MKKSDVELHGDWRSTAVPAVNVKVHSYPHPATVAEKLGCSEAEAEKALGYAFEAAQEVFWEDVPEWAKEIFGPTVKVYSGGRSGGWVEVHNLPAVESWDAIFLSKWAKFEKQCKAEVKYRSQLETILEDIQANGWVDSGPNYDDPGAHRPGCQCNGGEPLL